VRDANAGVHHIDVRTRAGELGVWQVDKVEVVLLNRRILDNETRLNIDGGVRLDELDHARVAVQQGLQIFLCRPDCRQGEATLAGVTYRLACTLA